MSAPKINAPASILSKDDDKAAKPGFRSPSNKKTKAMKKKAKKGGKKKR
ncbi:MAG: hypothetical protein GY884_22820 [Proteobacteria bacterium]|nr:hypothetical protein [Pseudomonadota bacterium]